MPRSSDSQTEAGRTERQSHGQSRSGAEAGSAGNGSGGKGPAGGQSDGPDLIDAINQVFAEFELAYHNQYHKAYSDPDRLVLTKKYWLQCLSEFYPMQLVAAARRLVKSQDYLPTISAMIRMCEQTADLFGLPGERDAYTEACRAPAPKVLHTWSHPAVYFAGKATDWFLLASEPEEKVYPLFCWNYRQLCERVIRGEELALPVTQALEDSPSRPLSYEERQARMKDLRQSLDV